MKLFKIFTILIMLSIIVIFYNSKSYAKYVFEFEKKAMSIDIDNTPPNIEILNVENTNEGYEKYANKNHDIRINLKIEDKNELINKLEQFKIIVGTEESNCNKEISITEQEKNYVIYEIKINNITENGELKITIPNKSFKDTYNNEIEETSLDVGICIDNIPPQLEYKQQILNNGKVLIHIISNEKIRKVDGWNLDESKQICSKEFISDIKYNKTVVDLAGNISDNLEIKVEGCKAFEYMAHISEIGWVRAENNFAGIIKTNNKYKIESLAFRTNDYIEKDFLKVSAYSYTYWEKGSIIESECTGNLYICGYNPVTGYSTMENTKNVVINGKNYLQISGERINGKNYTDIYGNNPIPPEIAVQYNYGISAIKLDLKDTSEYSIIYQIFFNDMGWSKTYKNGEEAIRDYTKPFEAIKIAIIPTSELENIIKEWNKTIGTYNLD